MQIIPSRTINEKSQVMGLNGGDLFALSVTFLLLQQVFLRFELEWVPLLISFFLAGILVSVRLKYRRKIIRDMLSYALIKTFMGGIYFVRKYRRNF